MIRQKNSRILKTIKFRTKFIYFDDGQFNLNHELYPNKIQSIKEKINIRLKLKMKSLLSIFLIFNLKINKN